MPATEVLRALGSFDVKLKPNTPKHLIDLLDRHRFGRIVVDAGRDNPEVLGDSLLRSARYVGVLRKVTFDNGIDLSGCGMAMWLGDEDGVGDVIESAVTIGGLPFPGAIRALLPPSECVVEGHLYDIGGATYRGSHIYESRRKSIDYVCDLFEADWRVNGDSSLDAGLPEDLFVTEPQAAIIADTDGWDMGLKALPGAAKMDRDAGDFTTRVVTVASGNDRTVAVGTADIPTGLNVYKDPFGRPVVRTRLVSESNTSLINADARAQLALSQYTTTAEAITVTSSTHDIRGDVQAGDFVWVFDPSANLIDYDNEIVFRGDRIWPVKLRVTQLSWPIVDGMGVYFRTGDGEWVDLTDYVQWDSAGDTTITVGGLNKSLTNATVEAPGSRVVPDTSVPAAPALVLPWKTSIYQSATGVSNARIIVAWSEPANTDGTVIRDGSHYEVQYRVVGDTAWQSSVVGFDFHQLQLLDLTVATQYEVRVRAVDIASPPHYGVWSDTVQVTTPGDTIPPATPAAPIVAAAATAIQVRHNLGAASGGTFNLDPDLHHLEVHSSTAGPEYEPDATTLLGTLAATQGMIAATTPAIGTFTVTSTAVLWVKVVAVDISGNRSPASVGAQSTAILIPSANIGDLDASKITSGDLTSTIGLLGLLRTAPTGARFEAGTNTDSGKTGMRLYRTSGTLALEGQGTTGDFIAYQPDGVKKTFRIAADTGNVYLYQADGSTPALTLTASTGLIDMVGKLTTGTPGGDRIEVNPAYTVPGGDTRPALVFRSDSATAAGPARVTGNNDPVSSTAGDYLSMASGPSAAGAVFTQGALRLYSDQIQLQVDDGTVDGVLSGLFLTGGGGGGSIAEITAGGITALSMTNTGTVVNGGASGQVVASAGGASGLVINSSAAQLGWSDSNRVTLTAGGSQLISGGTVKSFVIDHPVSGDRLLVHACLEGPASGVIYRGIVEIVDHYAAVELPAYFEALTTDDRQVFLQPDLAVSQGMPMVCSAAPTEIRDGRFYVICPAPDGTRVHWQVLATRKDASFPVEPLRSEVTVSGDGPYRYLAA